MSKGDFRKRVVNVMNDFEGWVNALSWKSLLLFTATFFVLAALDNEIAEGVEVGLGFAGLALLLFGKGVKWLNDNF